MSSLLKGNFKVKRNVDSQESGNEAEAFKAEFKQKVLDSIGGSMVYVERKLLLWDEEAGNLRKDAKPE